MFAKLSLFCSWNLLYRLFKYANRIPLMAGVREREWLEHGKVWPKNNQVEKLLVVSVWAAHGGHV